MATRQLSAVLESPVLFTSLGHFWPQSVFFRRCKNRTKEHTFLFGIASCTYGKQLSTLLMALKEERVLRDLWALLPCCMCSTNTGGNSTQMCINHDGATGAHNGFSTHFGFSFSLLPPQSDTQPEVEAQQMKRQSRGTRHATEEQKPRGQIEVENGMKDLPSSDPRQQRPFEGLLPLHSA